MSHPVLSGRLLRSLACAAYLVGLCLPDEAFASGSWAVPRFTPTWAELERDLKLLGQARRPVKRRVAKPQPQAVAAATTGTATPVDGAAAAASAGTATTPAGGGQELGIVSFLVNTLGVPLGIYPYDPMSIACRCPVPGGAGAGEPGPPPPDQKPPDAVAQPPPDQKPAADTTKKQKKKPVDSKKLDRKKYWWQEDQ